MSSDNLGGHPYAELMAESPAHIILNIDTTQPIELGNFVSAFTALASQYSKFMKQNHPDLSPDANIYVKEVRPGSIEADLIPWLMQQIPVIISEMEQVLIVEQFVRTYGARLGAYLSGRRDPAASDSDLKDFMGSIEAIANDPNGKGAIKAAYFEHGEKQIRAAIEFDTRQAQTARETIEEHRREIEYQGGSAEHKRVLMTFSQSNIKDVGLGKRTEERVAIEEISPRELPLIYASDLAERQIKHEIRDVDENVFKKGFIVDVNVQIKDGKPVGYRVTNLHQVIDLPDDGD
jgi:hypothetical protein